MLSRSRTHWSALVALLFAAVPGSALAGPISYVVSQNALNVPGLFGTMDLSTGVFMQIGPANPAGYIGISTVGATVYAIDNNFNLVSINPMTGIPTVIGNTGISFPLLAGSPSGAQYAVDVNNDLYSINTTTGAATLIGPTGLPPIPITDPTAIFENSFAISSNALYYTYELVNSLAPALYTLNPSTGAATLVGPTQSGIVGAGFINNTLYGFTGPFVSTTDIYTLDPATGSATLVTPTPVTVFGAAQIVPEPSSLALAGGFFAVVVSYRAARRLRCKQTA
jgi:hypothetical protein